MPQLAQGIHLLPLDALRTFNLFSPALTQRQGGLLLFSPALAQGEEDFFCSRLHSLKARRTSSVLACTHSKARRTSSVLACTHSKARRTSSVLACTRSKARRTSSVASRRTRALRSLIITGASDRRKTMRSFKLFNYCHRSSKDDGNFKTFN